MHMGYIFGICGVVGIGSVVILLAYSFYNKRYDLDNMSNAKEDRLYGNVDLDYYDDDERVEMFEDIVDLAKQAEDEEFERTVDEINKFVARRSEEGNNASMIGGMSPEQMMNAAEQPVEQPQVQEVYQEQPVLQQAPVMQPVIQKSVNSDEVEEL